VALFLVLAGFLAATYSYRRITDTELNSFQTRALVLHGDVDLSRYPRVNRPGYFTIEREGKLYSIYGTGVSIVAAPVYAILARTDSSESVRQAAAAIPFVALAILLMYSLLSRIASRPIAVAGAIVYGFGTTMWPLASMALFQHGPVAVFQLIGLLGLFSERPRAPVVAGLGFAAAAFIRPTTAITFALVGLYQLARGRRATLMYALGSLVPVAGMLIQNRWIWGTWLEGGYSRSGIAFDADMPSALWGLTLGWWRGIFVYSPVLLLGVAGLAMAIRRFRDEPERKLVVLGVAVVATVLFYSRWSTWHNGSNQFGYRYLLDIVPSLVVLGVYAAMRSERLRTYSIPLAALSLLTMTFGAAPNNFGFDGPPFPSRLADTSLGQAWITFFDQPSKGLIRIAGLAVVAAVFATVAPRRDAKPSFASEAR
jgi:MFS family permease